MVASRKMGWGLHPITFSGGQCEDIFWSITHGQNSKADKIFCSRNIQLFSDLVISSYINHDR